MRGKLAELFCINRDTGITPADAGKTRHASAHSRLSGDHPRGCGENLPDFKFSGDVKGSPPRMRGKLSDCWKTLPELRITPADAGKT